MKGLIDWWGRNPVAGNLLMLACAIAGFLSFVRMDKEFWPAGRGDIVQINAFWPGASPEDMESQVTVRLEEAVADLDGVNWIRSRSAEGFAWVNVFANPSTDMDALTAEVRSRVDAVSGLPAGLEPPRVAQMVGRNFSIILAVRGETDERTVRDTAENLRDGIAALPGAANTITLGARRPEVSIELSEEALQRYGLTFDEVAQAIRGTSVNISSGAVRTAEGQFQLRARNLADTEQDFSAIVVRQTPEGGAITVGDVATVKDAFEDRNVYSKSDGQASVLVVVQTADKFNIVETGDAVEEHLKKVRETLPAGLEIVKIYDEREDYSRLLGILFSNALQGFTLIFIMLLLTLHPKVAMWASFGVMTAFAGSFFILPYVDVSLNFMTVFAFLMVLGIMVDDAIIVGEAIYERVERGERGADAAILATQLVLKPLMASVITTMIAFAPFMFLSGEVQQFTRSISIVVMSTLAFSLVETLIILPAHLSHVTPLTPGRPGFMGRLATLQVRCADSVLWVARNLYGPLVRTAVRNRYATLAAFIVVFLLSVSLLASGRVKQTFMPEVEGDFMIATIELPQSTPFARMETVAEQLDAARRKLEAETADVAVEDPNTGTMSRGVIRSWSQAIDENTVQAWVGLTPPETRELGSKEVTKRMTELLGEIPDAERISFDLTGNGDSAAIELALMSDQQEDLRAAVEELKAKLLTYSAISSVRDSEEAAVEELRFTLKPGAEQLGLTLAEVSRQVRQAYFGEEVQRLPRDGDDVRVYVRYPKSERETLDSLNAFRVRTPDGREIPLAAVADVAFADGVTGIDRRQRMRSIMVEAEAPQEERAKIMKALNEEKFFEDLERRYPSVTRRAIGQAESQAEFFADLMSLGAMALFAMYMLLAITFRSYAQPALIMSVIPFALVGAAIGHALFGMSFALFSWLGMIAAMGVLVNDNVVLIDRVNTLRAEEGLDGAEGIIAAGISRFRQIFLTSVTEFVGLAPMILEQAAIAQFLKPMALALGFGVLFAMPATLLLTPCLYMIGKDLKGAVGGGVRRTAAALGLKPRARPAE